MNDGPPPVTVCVPVWNGAAFVADTLACIARQSFADFRVLVSLDRGDDGSEAICRRFLADRRFELVVQPNRLGWVGNVNFLIGRVTTEFFCITPHDDLLHRDYLARVFGLAAGDPAISTAYSDIATFGDDHVHIVQPEVRGDRLHRLLDVLLNHGDSVAFRGLVRRRGPDDRPLLPTGLVGDFAADTVWLVDLAARGELRRVPGGFYRKRLHGGSAHAAWERWPIARRRSAWIDQAARMAIAAAGWVDGEDERGLVAAAAMMRLMGLGAVARPPFAATRVEQGHEVAAFAARIHPLAVPERPTTLAEDARAAPLSAARLLETARRKAGEGAAAEAITEAARAQAADPLGGHAPAFRLRLLVRAAKDALARGEPAAARAPAAAALRIDPDDYHAALLQAELLAFDGDVAAALAVLRGLDARWPGTRPVAQRIARFTAPGASH
ncbi:hypothetical protein STAQ_42520 [Allostella sp. ATCC 35155]|nr:hypothetical protein STAQ_42520 [Stella sp. ATCC 35155]